MDQRLGAPKGLPNPADGEANPVLLLPKPTVVPPKGEGVDCASEPKLDAPNPEVAPAPNVCPAGELPDMPVPDPRAEGWPKPAG
jgi:hypothetical protein